jgi:hypothetical protein
VIVIAHIAGVPVEEWLPFVVPVVALYLYGRHRERRRGQAVQPITDPSSPLHDGTVRLVQAHWAAAGHRDLDADDLPLLRPPGPDGLTATEIAARLGAQPRATQALLERLQQRGYVELEPPDGGQPARAWLTIEGHDALLVAEKALLGSDPAGAGPPAQEASEQAAG